MELIHILWVAIFGFESHKTPSVINIFTASSARLLLDNVSNDDVQDKGYCREKENSTKGFQLLHGAQLRITEDALRKVGKARRE